MLRCTDPSAGGRVGDVERDTPGHRGPCPFLPYVEKSRTVEVWIFGLEELVVVVARARLIWSIGGSGTEGRASDSVPSSAGFQGAAESSGRLCRRLRRGYRAAAVLGYQGDGCAAEAGWRLDLREHHSAGSAGDRCRSMESRAGARPRRTRTGQRDQGVAPKS